MKKVVLSFSLILALQINLAQELDEKDNHLNKSGRFELGTRTTLSLFENDGYTGFGAGGQFRIWLGNKLNTEWYADYITTDIGGLGNRKTGHIGWSVMFYPLNTKKITPYLVAGHCFDYATITVYDDKQTSKSRKSAAVQIGIGTSFILTEKLDFSISGQYMSHIGDDIHTYETTLNGKKTLSFDNPDEHSHSHSHGTSIEGHLLITVSLNFKIAKLW